MAVSKSEILQAATDCFFTYGYSKTSMKDIGQKVGLNKASLYYHYKDKLAIYEAVIQQLRQEHMTLLEPQLKQTRAPIDKVLLFIEGEIQFTKSSSRAFPIDPSEVYGVKTEVSGVYLKIIEEDIQRIEAFLTDGIVSGSIKQCDTNRIAVLIMSIVEALLNKDCPLYYIKEDRDAAYDHANEEIQFAVQTLLDGIKKTKEIK